VPGLGNICDDCLKAANAEIDPYFAIVSFQNFTKDQCIAMAGFERARAKDTKDRLERLQKILIAEWYEARHR